MPIMLANFISFFSEFPRDIKKGLYLGGGVVALSFLNCVMAHHTNLYGNIIGMRIRIACSSLVYRKVLRLDKVALDDTDIGKLVNLLSNDVNRFEPLVSQIHNIWIMPIQVAIGSYLMYSYVGVSAFVGVGFMLLQALSLQDAIFDIDSNMYMSFYTVLIILVIILSIARSLFFFYISMSASRNLHNLMFSNVLKATMRFFDTNPSGRILNRFSKDIGSIDEMLPNTTMMAIQMASVAFGILGMTFVKSYIMIIPAIVLAYGLYWIQKVFMKGTQEVKRIEGTAKAPVFSYVAATMYGLPTIRSANAEDMVRREFDIIQDQHTSAFYTFLISFEALGFYLDMVSVLFIFVVNFQFLFLGNAQGADVGLVISQCSIIIGMLQMCIRHISDVASNMTSVERVLQYTNLDQEGPYETLPTQKPPRSWPEAGRLTFTNVYLRYIPDGEPVLKNLNIEIEPCQKIGIVGRTGAGKSTLISALFRLAPTDATIQIDGVDISKIGLTDLRSKISIIPQTPTLFSETVRYNLDPFGKSDDKTLWNALENVELKKSIDSLDMKVSEGGSNFSVVMDEATANVDPQTDFLIQESIRRNFKQCTVLTVAHRLNTIMDSDKVIVMDAGQLKEFAPPYELLQNPEGFFSKMLAETGSATSEKLKTVAKEHYFKNK